MSSTYMTEEEQIEMIKSWFSNYGNYLLYAITLIMLLIVGYRYWAWYQEKNSVLASNAYEHMILAYTNKDDVGTESYANGLIKEFGHTVYADGARLMLAKAFVQQNKLTEAVQQLDEVAHQGKIPAIRQVAKLRAARILMSEKLFQEALNVLDPVVESSYQPAVEELKGDIYLAKGDYREAQVAYQMAMQAFQAKGMVSGYLEMKTNQVVALDAKSKNG